MSGSWLTIRGSAWLTCCCQHGSAQRACRRRHGSCGARFGRVLLWTQTIGILITPEAWSKQKRENAPCCILSPRSPEAQETSFHISSVTARAARRTDKICTQDRFPNYKHQPHTDDLSRHISIKLRKGIWNRRRMRCTPCRYTYGRVRSLYSAVSSDAMGRHNKPERRAATARFRIDDVLRSGIRATGQRMQVPGACVANPVISAVVVRDRPHKRSFSGHRSASPCRLSCRGLPQGGSSRAIAASFARANECALNA